jgi:hypothetical protein
MGGNYIGWHTDIEPNKPSRNVREHPSQNPIYYKHLFFVSRSEDKSEFSPHKPLCVMAFNARPLDFQGLVL